MGPLMVDDAREMLLALQDEIRRSEEARYDHRLHGVLLVAQGMNAPKVARLLGDGVRTVEYWGRALQPGWFCRLGRRRTPRSSSQIEY